MNQLPGPDAEQGTDTIACNLGSFLTVVSLPAAVIALITFNVVMYLQSRSVEYHIRRNWTGAGPWLWPEDTLGWFLLAWVLTLIASSVTVFRIRHRILKYETGILAAGALVAIFANALFLMAEALNF